MVTVQDLGADGQPISGSDNKQSHSNMISADKFVVTPNDMSDEERQQYEEYITMCQQKFSESFELKDGRMIQKSALPKVVREDKISKAEADGWPTTTQLDVMVSESVHRALTDHMELLAKSVYNKIQSNQFTTSESVKPVYPSLIAHGEQFSHQIEKNLRSAGGQLTSAEGQSSINDEVIAKLIEAMKEQFDLKPREQNHLYRRPYPEWMEKVALPSRYKIPEFYKFSGQDDVSTIEHISCYLAQLGEASVQEALKVRLFSLSLSGSAFLWFTSLPPDSIKSWADLEKKFHSYFYMGMAEMSISDLTAVQQYARESVADFIQRFRNIHIQCHDVNLSDRQLAELAFQGLIPQLQDKFSLKEFEGLSDLVQRVSAYESQVQRDIEIS